MEATKGSKLTCQSKSFISIFLTCQVSACELQPFSCHDLANEINSQTAKTVFSHLNLKPRKRNFGEFTSRKFLGGACFQKSLEAFAFSAHLGNWSIIVLDPLLIIPYHKSFFILWYGQFFTSLTICTGQTLNRKDLFLLPTLLLQTLFS